MTDTQDPPQSFGAFIERWDKIQNRETPDIHKEMAEWLELCWLCKQRRMLIMAFREAGKSTIVGLFAAWLIACNPDIRILVLAADLMLAKKMVRNVKRIIERHPQAEGLKPRAADQWASDRFTVNRALEHRDPTMLAKGITSNVTGSHADIVICDDVEVAGNCDTPKKREDLRTRLSEIPYVLTSGGSVLYVGTPHVYYSIYADQPRTEINEESEFLSGYDRLLIPLIDEQGNSVWPERYSNEDIEQKKIDSGPNKFDSQMMLKFVNILEGRLNPNLFRFYNDELGYEKNWNKMFIGSREMVSASSWWDPSFASARGDDSVCAVVFTDGGGENFLHHLEYIRVDEDSKTPEVDQQVEIVAQICKNYFLPSIVVESNGIGGFLPSMLRSALVKINALTRVIRVSSTKPKAQRILDAFDAKLAARRIWVHQGVRDNTNFIMEMREWRPSGGGLYRGSSKGVKDDALDAVAGALAREPERFTHTCTESRRYPWPKGKKPHMAKTEYPLD